MNDLMIQMLDQWEAGLMDRTLKVMHVLTDEKYRFPLELNKSQCALMLLGTKDTGTMNVSIVIRIFREFQTLARSILVMK